MNVCVEDPTASFVVWQALRSSGSTAVRTHPSVYPTLCYHLPPHRRPQHQHCWTRCCWIGFPPKKIVFIDNGSCSLLFVRSFNVMAEEEKKVEEVADVAGVAEVEEVKVDQAQAQTTSSSSVRSPPFPSTECPICREPYIIEGTKHVLDCGHTFHASCLVNAMVHGEVRRCPMCRAVPVTGARDAWLRRVNAIPKPRVRGYVLVEETAQQRRERLANKAKQKRLNERKRMYKARLRQTTLDWKEQRGIYKDILKGIAATRAGRRVHTVATNLENLSRQRWQLTLRLKKLQGRPSYRSRRWRYWGFRRTVPSFETLVRRAYSRPGASAQIS